MPLRFGAKIQANVPRNVPRHQNPSGVLPQFDVKKGTEFVLPPDTNSQYKLIEVTGSDALIRTPTGEKFRVRNIDP
jgi:hypothetical protein